MLKRFIFLYFIVFALLISRSYSQDEEEVGTESSQDLYIAFDQSTGNTNNLVTGLEYSYSLVGDIASLSDTEFSISLGGNYATLDEEPYALDGNFHMQLINNSISWRDGYIITPDKPGLGIDFNEKIALNSPYKEKSLHLEMQENPPDYKRKIIP